MAAAATTRSTPPSSRPASSCLTIDGGLGDDNIQGPPGRTPCWAATATTSSTAIRVSTPPSSARRRSLQLESGRRERHRRRPGGTDELFFNGSNANENVGIFANGARVSFQRDVAAINMDLDDIETITFNAIGGTDNITIGNLVGTDVTKVVLNLAGNSGAADGLADIVTVNATAALDSMLVSLTAPGVITITGLAWTVEIRNFDSLDKLVINGGIGNDTIDAASLPCGHQARGLRRGRQRHLAGRRRRRHPPRRHWRPTPCCRRRSRLSSTAATAAAASSLNRSSPLAMRLPTAGQLLVLTNPRLRWDSYDTEVIGRFRGNANRSLKYCRFCRSGRRSPSIDAAPRLVSAKRSCQPGSGIGFQWLSSLVGGADEKAVERISSRRVRARRARLANRQEERLAADVDPAIDARASGRGGSGRYRPAEGRAGARSVGRVIPAECTRSSIRRKR
jgi:hypothetical protein